MKKIPFVKPVHNLDATAWWWEAANLKSSSSDGGSCSNSEEAEAGAEVGVGAQRLDQLADGHRCRSRSNWGKKQSDQKLDNSEKYLRANVSFILFESTRI